MHFIIRLSQALQFQKVLKVSELTPLDIVITFKIFAFRGTVRANQPVERSAHQAQQRRFTTKMAQQDGEVHSMTYRPWPVPNV
jgi:hypothetical protein